MKDYWGERSRALTININVYQVAPICQAIAIIIVTTLKPVTALHSAEISVSDVLNFFARAPAHVRICWQLLNRKF